MQFAYDNFGQLVTEYQQHGGAVNTGTSLKVQYAYADGSSNTIRLTKMTYPNGRELNYSYGSAGSTDDALSRVASLIDDDGTTHLVDYSYLGRNTFVKTDYPEPDLRYDLAMGVGDDPYDGFDRFGRIVDSRWYDYGSSADVDRILYGYDRLGNRTFREQTCDPNSHHDEVYGYDSVNRLTGFDRGTINGNKDAISTLKFAQQWSLDPTGNWPRFKEDDDDDSSWDLEQSRTSNTVNEITDITETSGPAWVTPVHNRAGNMTTIPKPGDPTSSFDATYDAWNRLVKLEEGANTVAEYVYDGAKRRVVKRTYESGQLDETRHFCYTDPLKWQVIEERLELSGEISANADRQFVWGLRYIDDFVLRDHDTDSNGTLDERLYGLQDANWNVTAIADTSGTFQERYAYSAYGTPRVLTPTFATRGTSNHGTEVLYAGYRYDAESGLCHVRNRVHHSNVGSWVQRDPVEYAGGENLYSYAAGNPLRATDPSGLFWNLVGGFALGCLAGAGFGATGSFLGNDATSKAICKAIINCLVGGIAGLISSVTPGAAKCALSIAAAIVAKTSVTVCDMLLGKCVRAEDLVCAVAVPAIVAFWFCAPGSHAPDEPTKWLLQFNKAVWGFNTVEFCVLGPLA